MTQWLRRGLVAAVLALSALVGSATLAPIIAAAALTGATTALCHTGPGAPASPHSHHVDCAACPVCGAIGLTALTAAPPAIAPPAKRRVPGRGPLLAVRTPAATRIAAAYPRGPPISV